MQELAGAPSWTIVDLILGAGLLLSIVVGAWRGLVREVLGLLGWGAAYIAAQVWGPSMAATVPFGAPGSRLNVLSGMVVVFVLAWMVWAMMSWALRQIVTASGLAPADRVLGSVFGLLRGLMVALVVFTLVSMTPAARWAPWQASVSVPWLQVAMDALRPLLPAEVASFLTSPAPAPTAADVNVFGRD